MTSPPAGLPHADWEATPTSVGALLLDLLEQNRELREQNQSLLDQVTTLATRVAQLEEQKGRSSRNSSQPPSSDGPGQRGSGFGSSGSGQVDGQRRKRGGQLGHPGHGRDLLPSDLCDEVIDHHPDQCGSCGASLSGASEGAEPWRHQIIDIPPVTPIVVEHRLHQLICPCCQSATRAVLPAAVENSGYGPRLTALVGTLGSTFHLSHLKIQRFLGEGFGVRISTGGISCIRRRLNDLLEQPVREAHLWLQGQPILQADETSYPVGNADGNNPEGRGGWLWVLRNASVTFFDLQLSRSGAVAQQLIGEEFSGILICDRYGAYNCLPLEQRQFCWAHIRRDLIAIAERSGVSAEIGQALLSLQGQLFDGWHAWLNQQISRAELEAATTEIRQAFAAKLEWAIDLGSSPGETTPLARTLGTCRTLLNTLAGLWTFLAHPDLVLTNNASERALRPVVIARKLSSGVQSTWGGQFVGRIMTVTTSLEQQGRDTMAFLMELINARRENRPLPSLIPQTE
jgi:transposase